MNPLRNTPPLITVPIERAAQFDAVIREAEVG